MINLLICGNRCVFDGMLITMLSITKHTEEPINLYIMTMDLRDMSEKNVPIGIDQKDYLDKILKNKNPESKAELIDITELFLSEMSDSVNLFNFYTPYCLLRLFAAKVKELPSKILYLDTDIIANRDIKELYDIDISQYEFAAVRDYLGKIFKYPRYFNSGVMLMNLDEIRKTELFDKALKICRSKRLAFPDQDSLNRLSSKWLMIPPIYNSQRKYHKNDVLQHFCKSIRLLPVYHTINVKPWEVERVHKRLWIHEYDDILEDYLKRKGCGYND